MELVRTPTNQFRFHRTSDSSITPIGSNYSSVPPSSTGENRHFRHLCHNGKKVKIIGKNGEKLFVIFVIMAKMSRILNSKNGENGKESMAKI
ncbi:MAG: hypothetical protein GY820_21585 [Gammaproteobacteria bacterium]|nr:hypothetical protein [Gammaproteobacteria bacterium]